MIVRLISHHCTSTLLGSVLGSTIFLHKKKQTLTGKEYIYTELLKKTKVILVIKKNMKNILLFNEHVRLGIQNIQSSSINIMYVQAVLKQ